MTTSRNRLAAACLLGLACVTTASAQPAGDAARGQAAFMKNMCFSCHGTQGQGGDRGAGPALAPNVFPIEAFRMQLRNPRQLMPRFPKQFVSDQDVADMHAYLSTVGPGPKARDIPALGGS